MLNTAPRPARGSCMSPAVPVSCIAAITCCDTPVAPIGCPRDFRPPDGLTGSLPSRPRLAMGDRARAWPVRAQAHRLVFQQFGDREAVVRLDEVEVRQRDAGGVQALLPRERGALELR